MRELTITLLLTAATLGFGQSFNAESFPNPSGPGSIQPNLSAAPDGSVVLSWVEPAKGGAFSLRYAVRHESKWSEPHTVAAQRHFFRHPAEMPEVVALNDHMWLAHWVEMPKEGSEAEYVYVSCSTDGVHWTEPVIAHKDRAEVEHGLVSMAASGPNEVSLMWLHTPEGEDGPGYLMRTIVNASTGKEIKEERIDSDVCACCPTAIAKTPRGLLVAYRDHTPEDIRDISVVRFENGRWSEPKNVNPDNWKLNACPTNAAALSAKGDRVALAWYTGSPSPRVEVVFSFDGGTTFSKPVVVSTGRSFGYTSVAMNQDGSAIVSWLEQGGTAGARVLARNVTQAGPKGPAITVAEGGRMGLGYPKLVESAEGTFITWCDSKTSKVLTARLNK